MKRLYARLVLWLIGPALELRREQARIWSSPTAESVERAKKEWNEMLRSLR